MQFHPLETIEEELEHADHTIRRHTRDDEGDDDEEEEDGDCQVPVEVGAQPAEVQSEEDGVVLGVMRPRRKSSCQGSRSSGESSASFPPLRVRPSPYESSHISSEGKKKRDRTYQKSTNGKLRKKVSLWCSFSMTFKDPPHPLFLNHTSRNVMGVWSSLVTCGSYVFTYIYMYVYI